MQLVGKVNGVAHEKRQLPSRYDVLYNFMDRRAYSYTYIKAIMPSRSTVEVTDTYFLQLLNSNLFI